MRIIIVFLLYCWYTLVLIYLKLRFHKHRNVKKRQISHAGFSIIELTLSHWVLANQLQVFCSVGTQNKSSRCRCVLLIRRFFLYDAYSCVYRIS